MRNYREPRAPKSNPSERHPQTVHKPPSRETEGERRASLLIMFLNHGKRDTLIQQARKEFPNIHKRAVKRTLQSCTSSVRIKPHVDDVLAFWIIAATPGGRLLAVTLALSTGRQLPQLWAGVNHQTTPAFWAPSRSS